MTEYTAKIRLLEPLLGTIPKDPEVYKNHVAKKAVEMGLEDAVAEEIKTVPELEEKGWTGFHSDKKGPILYDYTIKGFLCNAAHVLRTWGVLKQLENKVKRYVFVTPRTIRLPAVKASLERPLRAMTAQGPRVTVVRSDLIEAGTVIDFKIKVLEGAGIKKGTLKDLLEYGQLMGLGQWRSGGYGRFEVLSLDEK